MKNRTHIIFTLLAAIIGLGSCEKVLDIDLPDGVEGIGRAHV